jgi:hypothetical protein
VKARSEKVPTKVDVPSPVLSGDFKAVDFANALRLVPLCPDEGKYPESGVADSHSLERASSPISQMNHARRPPRHPLSVDEGPTDFSHPSAVEEQRIIWLPKDRLGLIDEILQDLAV